MLLILLEDICCFLPVVTQVFFLLDLLQMVYGRIVIFVRMMR